MRDKPLILIVDDDAAFLDLMTRKLELAGFEVKNARNGNEGVLRAAELMPDLILMDIMMPGGTGTDAALRIKQGPKTSELKIAFLSNLNDPWPAFSSREKVSKELGMADFLDKTEDLNTLVQKVSSLLARGEAKDAKNE